MWRKSITLRLALYFGGASTAVLLAIGYVVGIFVERHFLELDHTELHGKMELVRHVLAKVRSPADIEALPERMSDALHGPRKPVRQHHRARRKDALRHGRRRLSRATDQRRARRGASGKAPSWRRGSTTGRSTTASRPVFPPRLPSFRARSSPLRSISPRTTSSWRTSTRFSGSRSPPGFFPRDCSAGSPRRRGLAPVREMTNVAQSITASRLHDRLPTAALPRELVDLAAAFNGMLSRLEDSFRRLSEFSSDLAHELRTPIGSLMTQTQVALRGRDRRRNTARCCTRIRRSTSGSPA